MTRIPLELAFEACQQNKVAWLTCKAALSQAEMVYREYELTGHVTGRIRRKSCVTALT